MGKKIAIGCDPNAVDLKKHVIEELENLGYEYTDFGSDDPIYANVAFSVGKAVAAGEYWRGILFCGTGIGVSIAANKVKGVYAALVSDAYSAERAAKSNNANVITMGAQVTGYKVAQTLTRIWLESEFTEGTRSQPKVDRITEYDKTGK